MPKLWGYLGEADPKGGWQSRSMKPTGWVAGRTQRRPPPGWNEATGREPQGMLPEK